MHLKRSFLKGRKIYYVSVENPHCDCYATNIKETKYGVSFDAYVFGKEVLVELGVSGRHFVLNALLSFFFSMPVFICSDVFNR